MKTIEERAEEYVNRHNSLHFTRFLAYLKGATEQKQIDIDNACNWLENNAYLFVNDNTCSLDEKNLVEQFRKAMKGE